MPATTSSPTLNRPPRPMVDTSGSPAKSSLPAGYVVAWLLLAIVSISYISLITLWPSAASQMLPDIRTSEPETNEGQRARAQALAQVRQLEQDLAAARLNIARLETEIKNRDKQQAEEKNKEQIAEQTAKADAVEAELAKAVAAVEQTDQTGTAPATDAERSPADTSTQADVSPILLNGSGADKPAPSETGAISPADVKPAAPTTQTADATQPATAAEPAPEKEPPKRNVNIVIPPPPERAPPPPIETVRTVVQNAVAPATAPAAQPEPVLFGEAVVTPNQNSQEPPLAVELATGPSVSSLRLSWNLLMERYGPTLQGLQPRYVANSPPGAVHQSYNLVAGPVTTSLEAQKICQVMRGNGLPCAISIFSGSAL